MLVKSGLSNNNNNNNLMLVRKTKSVDRTTLYSLSLLFPFLFSWQTSERKDEVATQDPPIPRRPVYLTVRSRHNTTSTTFYPKAPVRK